MSAAKDTKGSPIADETLKAFDDVNGTAGWQAGFRPAHAKGILLTGSFTPSPDGLSLTRAPHIGRSSTPVTVRFSDFAGVPSVADNSGDASPRGMATRFHLAEHVHTDIIGHSMDGFPTRTVEEFLEFLHAVHAGAVPQFLAAHPTVMEFVMAPKPFPVSFATESFFAINAYRFINKEGTARYGRYRIRPDGAGQYLDEAAAAAKTSDYLFDEIKQRISKAPVKMRVAVQVAADGDVVDDATAHWPADRPEIAFGTIELTDVGMNNAEEQRHIIFDPIPRVDGIEPSADPLLDPRADIYLASGRRRRPHGEKMA